MSEKIRPCDTLACCWDVKQPTNKQTVHVQIVHQTSKHLCPAKLQTRCDVCRACQSHCSFISSDSVGHDSVSTAVSEAEDCACLCASQGNPSKTPQRQTKRDERKFVCLLVGCLTSQQHASVCQGRICSDRFTCCHTEAEVADTFHLTQLQYTDTGPTGPSTNPITPGAWQGSHWSANFLSHWYDSTPEKSRRKLDSNAGSSAPEADALGLTTRPTRRSHRGRRAETKDREKERHNDMCKANNNSICRQCVTKTNKSTSPS